MEHTEKPNKKIKLKSKRKSAESKLGPEYRRKVIKRRVVSLIICALAAAFVGAAALVTFAGGLGVPDWNDIFAACGVGDDMESEFSVSFINVGSGDCTLIRCCDTSFLIDGGTDLSEKRIFAYLDRSGVDSLDAVIVSHPDSDHIGSLPAVIEKYGADEVYMSEYADEHDVPAYTKLLSVIEKNKIRVIHPSYEQTVSFGGVNVCFYPPDKDYGSTNDNSLEAMLSFEGKRFLFTGDASSVRETALMESGADLSCDVLKIAHHGSKKSSSEEFLKATNAEYAVISVSGDDVQLPDYGTVARITEMCGTVYRTDRDYTIRFTLENGELKVKPNA